MANHRIDITGQTFGRLTALRYLRTQPNGAVWLCQCSCGSTVETRPAQLRSGNTNSCGCLKSEVVAAKNLKHGFAKRGDNAEYHAFVNARRRCTDPTIQCWKDYGGRGIQFRFESLEQFINEVGLRPSPQYSIDRIDNDGHYEVGNIRWATKQEQAANTRRSL
jgi:hypothetical protein